MNWRLELANVSVEFSPQVAQKRLKFASAAKARAPKQDKRRSEQSAARKLLSGALPKIVLFRSGFVNDTIFFREVGVKPNFGCFALFVFGERHHRQALEPAFALFEERICRAEDLLYPRPMTFGNLDSTDTHRSDFKAPAIRGFCGPDHALPNERKVVSENSGLVPGDESHFRFVRNDAGFDELQQPVRGGAFVLTVEKGIDLHFAEAHEALLAGTLCFVEKLKLAVCFLRFDS